MSNTTWERREENGWKMGGFPPVSKPGKSDRGIARRCKGKMQSEDARVENRLVVRQVYHIGGRYTTRDDSICPGLARSLRNHWRDYGRYSRGGSNGRQCNMAGQVKKKFSPAGNGKLTSCPSAILPASHPLLLNAIPPLSTSTLVISPRSHWHSNKICDLICNLIGKSPSSWAETRSSTVLHRSSSLLPAVFRLFLYSLVFLKSRLNVSK